jgi:hypothetical protein
VPWPGAVAVLSSPEADAGYRLDRVLERPSVMGLTESEMPAAAVGLWDHGPELLVRLPHGALESRSAAALLSGANVAAIGTGGPGGWEVFQFRKARLVAFGLWALSERLRGQRGTEGEMRGPWPAGSLVVLLDGGPFQPDLPPEARGEARSYRIGPARRSMDDPSYVVVEAAAEGIGLRPYAPVHLTLRREGDLHRFGWTRRSRIEGDLWAGEVPLGEAREAYAVRLVVGRAVAAEEETDRSFFDLTERRRADLGLTGGYRIEVAQLSDRFGPGPRAVLAVT